MKFHHAAWFIMRTHSNLAAPATEMTKFAVELWGRRGSQPPFANCNYVKCAVVVSRVVGMNDKSSRKPRRLSSHRCRTCFLAPDDEDDPPPMAWKLPLPLPWCCWAAEERELPEAAPVMSLISSSSSWSSETALWLELLVLSMEPWLMLDVREKDPRRGISVRWFAGFTVMIRFELLATIMSVT